ncbi:MAG: MBL fold metallo-hydrolase [Fimbriimonadales bacterium]|nr:MBL fold metallo-hydrolase [Fimbriimonadales bacterium]
MEAVVLGSGTSTGVPCLGIDYPAEFLADPRNHRTRPSLAVLGREATLLVDCTPDLRTQLLREGIRRVDAVVLTHSHADHMMGMDDLRPLCRVLGRPMPIYTHQRYLDDVRRVFPYAFRSFPEGIEVPRFDLAEMPDRLEVGDIQAERLDVLHGDWPVLALRIADFAYVTDVSAIPPPAWRRLQGLKTLILDAVRRRPHPNHFHLERALEVAAELRAQTTYLTHLCDEFDHGPTEARLPPGVRLAYDGLRIPL